MLFTKILKADVAADANPNTTPPADARVFQGSGYVDAQQREVTSGLAIRVLTRTAGDVINTDGTVSFQLWMKDEGTDARWFKVGAAVATLAFDTLSHIAVPAHRDRAKFFLQVTGVAGAAPAAAAKCELYLAEASKP